MEDYYLKGFVGRREWCSDKVNFKSYFDKYAAKLSIISKKRISDVDIMQNFVPQSNQLSQIELQTLEHITSARLLTSLRDDDFAKQPSSSETRVTRQQCTDSYKDMAVVEEFQPRPSEQKRRNRIKYERSQFVRREIPLDAAEKCGLKDVTPLQSFIVSFRIHEPFNHLIGEGSRPGRCTQQVDVLGYQPLSALRDKIICESDFQDTRGDISEQPDTPVIQRAREVYLSSMFYFDNSFYIDTRNSRNHDYSKRIKEWAAGRGIVLGGTQPMERTLVEDLEVRLGYPYLYIHQGSCEHLVIISDTRLLSPRDSLYSSDYPLMTRVTQTNLTYCMTCLRVPARWIVRESDLLAHDPTYQCKTCFKMMHYVNNKKVGNFKAWQYWQRSTLL